MIFTVYFTRGKFLERNSLGLAYGVVASEETFTVMLLQFGTSATGRVIRSLTKKCFELCMNLD